MRSLIIADLDTDMGAHGKRGALHRCGAGGLLPVTKIPGIHSHNLNDGAAIEVATHGARLVSALAAISEKF
jgi:hypothetical protein